MIRKILVAHGGADWSDAAFNFALDMAIRYKASLSVLSVVRLPTGGDEEETQAEIENGQSRLRTLQDKLVKQARNQKVELEKHVAVGHPAEQIVEWAEQQKIDLIVLGHHSRSKLGRWLLGGTADKVMDHAACSVVVIKGTGL